MVSVLIIFILFTLDIYCCAVVMVVSYISISHCERASMKILRVAQCGGA